MAPQVPNPSPKPDIQTLVQSALVSFVHIEPWCMAQKFSDSQDDVDLERLTNAIVKQADEYVLTIDMTMSIAYQGRALADSAIELCDLTSGDDLVRAPTRALHIIDALQEKSTAMTKQAKKVGSKVFQLSRDIALDIPRIARDKPELVQNGLDTIFITVPTSLDIDLLHIDPMRAKPIPTEDAREQQPRTFNDASAHLDQGGKYLAQLADSVINLSKWISSMKAVFLAFETITTPDANTSPAIRDNQSSDFDSATVRNEWNSIRTEFIECRSRIRATRDFYPTRLQAFTARASQVSLIAPIPLIVAAGKHPDSSTKERQLETPNGIESDGCGCLASLFRVLRLKNWVIRRRRSK